MKTVRLTMAQALVRWMTAQQIEMASGEVKSLFAGVFGIFGQGDGVILSDVGKWFPGYISIVPKDLEFQMVVGSFLV